MPYTCDRKISSTGQYEAQTEGRYLDSGKAGPREESIQNKRNTEQLTFANSMREPSDSLRDSSNCGITVCVGLRKPQNGVAILMQTLGIHFNA